MNFTPKIKVGTVVGGILALTVVGLIGWRYIPPTPRIAHQNTCSVEQLFGANEVPHLCPVEAVYRSRFPSAKPLYYQPATAWYKNKHWWKKNAPIVGGVAGGGLVGGLLGGGKGALIGGAVGGGGGYLYKRHKSHEQKYKQNYQQNYQQNYHH